LAGLSAGGLSVALAAESGAVIGHGKVRGYDWFVEAGKEGNSICFEVAVEKPHNYTEDEGVGQCSSPSRRRGILLVVANAQKDSERPKVVAIGGAFNTAVSKVKIVRFDGSVAYLHLRHLRSKTVSNTVRKFKYVAAVVAGPWCAKTFTTLDRHGHPLWTVGWKIFDVGWRWLPNSDPSKLCPH
jgi:hypothetical protein